jgi:hypothetical protein
MKSQTEEEYDDSDYDYDDDLTKSENVIASRRCKFVEMDGEYYDAIQTLSLRVKCPRCSADRKQVCRGTMHNEPAHKSRIKLLNASSRKVISNLWYAINSSKKWRGNDVIVKVNGKYECVSSDDSRWRRLVRETYGEACDDKHLL